MLLVILLILSIPGFYLGKFLFDTYFNHISIYTAIWFGMLFFYNLGFIRYYPLSFETWGYIILAYISLILGTITVSASRNIFCKDNVKNETTFNYKFLTSKKLKNTIIIYSAIGIFAGIQHWMVLLKMYGSFPNILLHGSEIYRMRVEDGIPGIIPYLQSFSYVALFLVGIYGAGKKSLPILAVFPLLGVIIKELANFSRAGILLGFVIFIVSYYLTKNFMVSKTDSNKSLKRKRNILLVVVIFSLLIGSAVFIRAFRGTVESFSGTSRELSSLRSNLIISPSIYLYMSAHVGVFNKYLKVDEEESEVFGKNTFLPIYHFLSKLGLIKHFKQYQRGYYIPVWTNTGTYLREVHSDFGIVGILLVPYLLGMFITILIYNLEKQINIYNLIILVYLFTVIIFSFLVLVSRLGVFYISFIISLITIFSLQSNFWGHGLGTENLMIRENDR